MWKRILFVLFVLFVAVGVPLLWVVCPARINPVWRIMIAAAIIAEFVIGMSIGMKIVEEARK